MESTSPRLVSVHDVYQALCDGELEDAIGFLTCVIENVEASLSRRIELLRS